MSSTADTHYLRLQYWEKVHRKNGTEFQSFFEDMMQCLYDDFKKIKPYGSDGDKKNDGFREKAGIYYQVYAPEQATDKQQVAVDKLMEDFKGLYDNWQEATPIKEFYFVFNDKDLGLAPAFFTDALASLRKDYPDITFDVLTPKQLESEFFRLSEDDKIKLGFSVDKTKIVALVTDLFADIEKDLDRACYKLAVKSLENLKDSVESLNNETLTAKYELLEAKILRNLGKENEAKAKYQSLMSLYPADPAPILYLAEQELDKQNEQENSTLLQKAEQIDPNNTILRIHKLVREIRLGNAVDTTNVDENSFPDDKREKSTLYRLYAICYERNKEHDKANQFIEKAIRTNPDRLSNYQIKLALINGRFFREKSI